MRFTQTAVVLAALAAAGCGEYEMEKPSGRSAAPEAVGVVVDPSALAEPASAPVMVREKADVGAGRKGHYKPGFISTPLATYWRAQEMTAYRIKVPHALNLYKGTHGYFPKTQEEFENEILKPNMIELPELPAGHRYVYDPEKGELQIERPQ